jgi:hypothetical protein
MMAGGDELPEEWSDDFLAGLERKARELTDRDTALRYEALDEAERRIKALRPWIEHADALAIVLEEMASRDLPYATESAERFAEVTRRPLLFPFTRAGRRLFPWVLHPRTGRRVEPSGPFQH